MHCALRMQHMQRMWTNGMACPDSRHGVCHVWQEPAQSQTCCIRKHALTTHANRARAPRERDAACSMQSRASLAVLLPSCMLPLVGGVVLDRCCCIDALEWIPCVQAFH